MLHESMFALVSCEHDDRYDLRYTSYFVHAQTARKVLNEQSQPATHNTSLCMCAEQHHYQPKVVAPRTEYYHARHTETTADHTCLLNIATISLNLLVYKLIVIMQDHHLAKTLIPQGYSPSDNIISTFLDFN